MTYAIILAAGLSGRFGSNKLLYPAEGIPMFSRILATVLQESRFDGIVVVTAYDEIEEMVEAAICSAAGASKEDERKDETEDGLGSARRLCVVRNDRQDLGISYSVRLGAQAVPEGAHLMYFVADQPWVSGALIDRILREAEEYPEAIVAPKRADGNGSGNPVCFAPVFREKLMNLTGDRGGKQVIRRHPEALHLVKADELELTDYDERPAGGMIERSRAL